MELNKKLLSNIQLITAGLKTANQVFGSAIAVRLYVLFVVGLPIFLFLYFYVRPNPFILLALFTSPIKFIVFLVIAGLISMLIGWAITMADIQLLGANMEGTHATAISALTSSFVPAIYWVASCILLGIPFGLIVWGVVAAKSLPFLLVFLVTCFFLLAFFVFIPYAITIRGENPISSILYSWRLGAKYYFRILLFQLTLFGLCLVMVLAFACLLKAFLPAFFTSGAKNLAAYIMSLSIPMLYKIILNIIIAMVNIYIQLAINGMWAAMFLNLDYASEEMLINESELVFSQNGVTSPLPQQTDVPDVQVKQASIHTQTDAHTEKHLDEVYQAQEHLDRAMPQEEDRMPTILFDDEMARQMEENERKMQQHQEATAQKQQEDDQDSIKMSDKPL